ncbi:reverse transcriptase domain-containing protein [Tanacetum coccineum]
MDGQLRAGDNLLMPGFRFKDLLNKCPHHGFSPLYQIDTFYNSLNQFEQDSLNSAAGGETSGSGVTLAGPSVPPPRLFSFKEVEPKPETITDQVLTESTISVLPPVVQSSLASTSSELPPAPISSLVILDPNPHQPKIPYPLRLNKEKLQDKADIQIHSFLQMFKKIYFNISFAEALAHMPKFAKMVKDLLTNKEKLIEMANTPLNENCSAVLLKKLPEKLRDTGRFLILCDFYGFESCMALADLATQTVAYLAGIAEDVFVQVGKFTFPADFVVVDYDVDPRKLVFNVESTSKYPRKHGDESIHKIDILDITCEDHFHEVLNDKKSINPISGSPTPSLDPVIASLSPSLTPFRDSDFILEEIDTFLASDDSTSSDDDDGTFDMEGDIRFIETLLNNYISNDLPPPLYVFMINETEKIKSSIDDPSDLELKDLPPHFEYAFLERTSMLPVIIAKELKREEKEQLLKVLKSHKRAIAWKISDIRGIDPNFCTHKILMEEDFKPAVQHQRRVNPKIHEVIKAEVIKILDAGLIYPIFDSPWEKCHFMVKEGIILGHKISKYGIEVDKAKVDVIAKLPPLTMVKGIRSLLGHAGFYRRFIQDFSKIAQPMTDLLEKDTPFFFSPECQSSFEILKKKFTEAPILVSPDCDLPFELMRDASDFDIGAVLGQRKDKYFRSIHYASKTLSDAQTNYTVTEKELLAVVYAFEKYRSYLVLSKRIVYTDHSALKYLFAKQDAKPIFLRWILLLQEFNI